MPRPVMQYGRIEVCSIRPHEGMHLGVDLNLFEKSAIPQRAVDLSLQNRLEINLLKSPICEFDLERIALHEVY